MTVKADQDVYALHNDETLLQRLTVAVISLAYAIIKEADSEPNHERRLVWARKALADPRNVASGLAWAALGDPVIQAKAAIPDTITSAEFSSAVSAIVASLVVPITVAVTDVATKPENSGPGSR